MKNLIYPAVFHKDEDGTYTVNFPNLDGCSTYGYSLEEAFNMAGDALFAYLDAFDNVPAPSDINDVKAESGDFVQLVKAELYDGLSEVQRKKVIHEIETGLRQKGYTKNQAAQILGVNRSYMTKVAKGDSTPAPDMAKRIGLLLGFDWRVFYADGIAAI